MKAMIFAAGLGTRLRPLTDHKPKALVPLYDKPLLQHTIDYIAPYGFDEIIINVHHHARQIQDFIENLNTNLSITISDESEELLDTGGGLKKAAWFLEGNQPFLVMNSDVITNMQLSKMLRYHQEKKPAVTLAVRNDYRNRFLFFDDDMNLRGKGDTEGNHRLAPGVSAEDLYKFRFSGIHIIEPELLKTLPDNNRFPIMEWYMNLCKSAAIKGFDHSQDFWMDLGRPENLMAAEHLYPKIFLKQ